MTYQEGLNKFLFNLHQRWLGDNMIEDFKPTGGQLEVVENKQFPMSIRQTQSIHGLKLQPGKSRLDIRKT